MNKLNNEKKKLNPIPLSLRDKKRYISFKLESDKKFSEKEAKKVIWDKFLQLYGEVGCAESKYWIMSFDSDKGIGILRSDLKSVEKAKAGLLLLTKIDKNSVIPLILGISGTIKSLKE